MHILLKLFAVLTLPLTLLACASPGQRPSSTLYPDAPGGGQSATAGKAGAGKTEGLVPAVVGVPPDPGEGGAYRIAPQDLLKIEVFQVPEFSSEERVSEDGLVVMPLIGPVVVGNLTPKEAEKKLADILGKDYLQDPQVNVFIKEYANQNVTVGGAVNKPGVFPLKGRMTLMQGIALAEGVNKVANAEEVVIFRSQGGKAMQAYVVNLEEVQKGSISDPVLATDDRIIVPESGAAVFIQEVTGALRGFVSVNPFLY